MTITQRVQRIEESPTLAVTAKAKALRDAGKPVIGFGAGEPDFPTPDNIVAAAQRASESPENHRYSASSGLPKLRTAIAERAARVAGVEVDPGNVVVTNGGKHALFNVFMTLVEPGDEVIMPAPYWVSYPEQIRLCGGVPVFVDTDGSTQFTVSVDQLEALRTDKTKALVFVSPSNPTGTMYTPDQMAAVGEWAARNDIWIITDEIYSELVYGSAAFASMAAVAPQVRDRLVVVDGVSKSYAMTGWRLGWTIAPPEVTAGMATLQSHLTSNVCNVAQAAALEALTGPQDAVVAMRQAFERRRNLAVSLLGEVDGVDLVVPDGAFYVFPSFERVIGTKVAGVTIASTLQLCEVLLDAVHVAVVPGEAFGAPGYVRLSYALSDADLREGLTRIADVLA